LKKLANTTRHFADRDIKGGGRKREGERGGRRETGRRSSKEGEVGRATPHQALLYTVGGMGARKGVCVCVCVSERERLLTCMSCYYKSIK